MTSLRDLRETYKRSEILLPSLERHVIRQEALPNDDRRPDAMHPSEMAKSKWCGRHDYYRIRGEPADYKPDPVGFRRANQYEYGHHIHHKYQAWLWQMGILYGYWLCLDCGYKWWDQSPKTCHLCNKERLRYIEVPLDTPLITGHSDGIVLLDDPLERLLLEIKSIGINSLRYEAYSLFEKAEQEQMTPDEIWFLIKRPFPSHLRQGMLYLYLATIRYPELNINRIIFLYEWKPTQEVKEFVVTYNQTYIDNVLATVDDVYQALEQGEPPDRPAWAEITDKGCRSCEYRGTCWGSPHTKDQAAPQVRVKRVSAQRRKAIRS